ncbi:MAG: methionyl-tRNA formyltransferase [Proteobacteria bacterium]|nr:methionyl-tRNA formyltransferase [Pseudomonadota bacterium]
MITLGYFADGPWSHRALELIADDPRFKVLFIVPRFDTRDPVLAAWAAKLGVPFLPIEKVNAPEAIAEIKSFGAQLFVSMSFNQILKRPILDAAPMGFINCHAGALPFYRGRNILNWALINDEKAFGITVHYIDEGIDTGDILVQRLLPIDDEDTYATVLKRAITSCADVLHEALAGLEAGTLHGRVQSEIHPVGSYFGRRRPGDEWIDWTWSSRRIFNFVRAITHPGPCAMTRLDGKIVKIVSAGMIPDAPSYICTPGEIVGVLPQGVAVKTGDSTIFISAWEGDGEAAPRLKIGQRFSVRGPEPA